MVANELFVISIYNKAVFVYDTNNFKRTRTINNADLHNPRDIAATAIRPCLYIMEVVTAPEQLVGLDPVTGATLFKCKFCEDEGRNLAVDQKSGNVLLMCANSIVEYTPYGYLVRTVTLSADFHMAWQAIPLSNGGFFICQGWGSSEHHRVCILTTDGNIAVSSCGPNMVPLRDPVHASVDSASCFVVADSANNRVCLFSPHQLVWLRNLAVDGQCGVHMSEPYRALIDPTSGRLYIGTNDGHALILQVVDKGTTV